MTLGRSITSLAGAAAILLAVLAWSPAVAAAVAARRQQRRRRPGPRAAGRRRSALRLPAWDRSSVDSKGRDRLPVQEGRGDEERLQRRLRQRVAPGPGERQADGRRRGGRVAGRNHDAVRWKAAGHLQRPPALPLPRRPEAGRHNRPGLDGVRRRLVGAVPGGKRGHRPGIELGRRRIELRRWRWLLVEPRACRGARPPPRRPSPRLTRSVRARLPPAHATGRNPMRNIPITEASPGSRSN